MQARRLVSGSEGAAFDIRLRATVAGALFVKFQAVCCDANIELNGLETQAVCQEPLTQHDTFILNLDDLSAVGTNNVKCGR